MYNQNLSSSQQNVNISLLNEEYSSIYLDRYPLALETLRSLRSNSQFLNSVLRSVKCSG